MTTWACTHHSIWDSRASPSTHQVHLKGLEGEGERERERERWVVRKYSIFKTHLPYQWEGQSGSHRKHGSSGQSHLPGISQSDSKIEKRERVRSIQSGANYLHLLTI